MMPNIPLQLTRGRELKTKEREDKTWEGNIYKTRNQHFESNSNISNEIFKMKTVETQEENQNLDVLHKTLLQRTTTR